MKKGVYFATTSVLMVFFIVFGYSVINENQKEEIGTTDFGEYAFGLIKGNIEIENLKFFIEESVKVSKNIALKNVKEKALKDPESKMRRAVNAYAGERTKTLFNQWLSEEALVHA